MTSDTLEREEESNLVRYAREEMQRAGLFKPEADYDGEISGLILEMVKVFSAYGHSGGSAGLTLEVFNRVLQFQPLTPLTNDPEEWMRVNPDEEEVGIWQNRRQGAAFSNDGGKTYYVLDEPMTGEGEQPLHESKEAASA